MSAPSASMRIKINFDNLLELWALAPQKSWLLVKLGDIRTVGDLKNVIIDKFRVPNSISTQLILDSCVLPGWESVQILRENDEIWLVHGEARERSDELTQKSEEHVTNKQDEVVGKQDKKKKKKKRKHSEMEQDLPDSPAVVPRSKTDHTEPLAVSSSSTTSGESELEAMKIKSPKKMSSVKSTQSHTMIGNQSVLVEKDGSVLDSSVSKKAKIDKVDTAKPGEAKHHEEDESNMSALELAIKNTLASIQMSVDAEKQTEEVQADQKVTKKRRKRVRKNKKGRDGSYDWTPVEPKATTSVKTAVSSDQVDWNVGYQKKNYGRKHMTFNDSGNEEEAVQDNQVQSHVQEQNGQQTVVSVEKGNIEAVDVECIDPVKQTDAQNYTEVPPSYEHTPEVPQLYEHTPEKKARQKKSKKNNKDNNNSEAFTSNDGESEVKTFQKGPFANVKVFSRKQTKLKKKSSFVPLTKEEQLATVATNTSTIYQNTEECSATDVQPETAEPLEDEDVSMASATENTETEYSDEEVPPSPPKDYSGFPVLQGPPRVGDCIAYKIIEMNESYCPALSEYKEAKVLSYDTETQNLQLAFTGTKMNKKMGRFDVVIEDEDGSILTNTNIMATEVTVPWTSMTEPRLVTQ